MNEHPKLSQTLLSDVCFYLTQRIQQNRRRHHAVNMFSESYLFFADEGIVVSKLANLLNQTVYRIKSSLLFFVAPAWLKIYIVWEKVL